MGYRETYYKGFFIVFTPEAVDTEYQETRCTNPDCANSKKEVKEEFKFCPKCGSKIDWIDLIEKEADSYSNYDELEIPNTDDELNNLFYVPQYITEVILEDWTELDNFEHLEILICNQNFNCPLPADREKFTNHKATKFLLDTLKNCKIYYGVINYSI